MITVSNNYITTFTSKIRYANNLFSFYPVTNPISKDGVLYCKGIMNTMDLSTLYSFYFPRIPSLVHTIPTFHGWSTVPLFLWFGL